VTRVKDGCFGGVIAMDVRGWGMDRSTSRIFWKPGYHNDFQGECEAIFIY